MHAAPLTPAEEARWIVRDRMHDVLVATGEATDHAPRHASKEKP